MRKYAQRAARAAASGVGVATAAVMALGWSLPARPPAGSAWPTVARAPAGVSPAATPRATSPGVEASPDPFASGGPASCARHTQVRLFFGLSTPEGPVPDAEWTRFLREVVTPRFPRGLTVVHADGQWRARGSADVRREPSRVVEIVDDGAEMGRRIAEIVAAYRLRFRQESVMVTRGPVEVCF